MATTLVLKAAGPTYALSVAATAHAAVTITPYSNEIVQYVSLLNTGATVLSVDIDVIADTDVALPADGAAADFWILPASMTQPIVVAVPSVGGGATLQVTAIGSAAGPSLLYVRPLSAM